MFKSLLLGTLSLVISAQASASSFQYETELKIANTKFNSFDMNHKVGAILGTYYFTPVNTDNHPLREAAFMEKNGSISLHYARGKYDEQSNHFESSFISADFTSESEDSLTVLSADTYVLNDLIYIGGTWMESRDKETVVNRVRYVQFPDRNENTKDTYEDIDHQWRVNLGIAPVAGLLVWTELEKHVHLNHSWNINAKYVLEFSNSALNLQAGMGESTAIHGLIWNSKIASGAGANFSGAEDDDYRTKSAYVISDYYFTNSFSVGLAASHYSDFYIQDAYSLRANNFFTDKLSVGVFASTNSLQDTFGASVQLRF